MTVSHLRMAGSAEVGTGIIGFWPFILFFGASLQLLVLTPGIDSLFAALSNDSAMRLIMTRDLIAGQDWFDLTQYRLGLEGGIEMHWSRLVDGPIAGLILLFDLFVERRSAEYATLVAWPLIVLGAYIWAAYRIAQDLGGEMVVLLMPLLMLGLLHSGVFLPGNIDHHQIQAVLLLTAVGGVLANGNKTLWGAVSGAAVALSLSIGVETTPLLAVCGAGAALKWSVLGGDERRRALAFSISLAAIFPALFLATAPASAYRGGYCDALSTDLMLPVVIAAGSLAFLATLYSGQTARFRCGTLVVAGGFVVVLVFTMFPSCLSNPLDSLDPYLQERWLNLVLEAQGFWGVIKSEGVVGKHRFMYFPIGAMGVGAALLMGVYRRNERFDWLFLAVLLAIALVIAAYQVRGVVAVLILSIISIAAGIGALCDHLRRSGRLLTSFLVILSSVLFLPSTWSNARAVAILVLERGSTEAAEGTGQVSGGSNPGAKECWGRDALDKLAEMRPGTVSTNSNLGAQLLLTTPHRVLSAPYHRNQAGMRAQLEIQLADDADDALRHLREYHVDYVVLCEYDSELAALSEAGFTGFGHKLAGGAIPEYLRPLEGFGDRGLKVWRVVDNGTTLSGD